MKLLTIIPYIIYFILFIYIINTIYWTLIHKNKMSKFQIETHLNNNTKYNKVPKIIWTYWHSEILPDVVKKCINGWKKFNPNYEIIILNKNNYKNYINIPIDIANNKNYNDFHARFADLIRICILADKGGVWIDSSIILSESLDKWLFNKYGEFSGFYLDSFGDKYPVIENWFFASNKNSNFMRLWRDEFLQISKYNSVSDYINSRRDMGVDFQDIPYPIYLAMHISCQKILQIDKYPLDTLVLKKAEDGPYKYLIDSNWYSIKGLYIASMDNSYTYPIMKMRGGERNILINKINKINIISMLNGEITFLYLINENRLFSYNS